MSRKSRRSRKNDGNQFPGRREETAVYRGPGDRAPDQALQLAPSLRNIPMDNELPVVAIPDDDREPPPYAGDYVATTNKPVMIGNQEVPAGYRIYRDTRLGQVRGEVPAAFRRPSPGVIQGKLIAGGEGSRKAGIRPGDVIAREQPIGFTETDINPSGERSIPAGSKVYRVAGDPDLAREFARDTGYENAGDYPAGQPAITVTDDPDSIPDDFDGLVIEDTDPDDESAPVRISYGKPPPVRGVPEGTFLPEGFEHRDPDPPRIMALRANAVLLAHARLAAIMRRPPDPLLGFFDYFIGDALAKAKAEGSDDPLRAVHSKWAGSFWPAKNAKDWCGVLARQLSAARTYQVSADMGGEVTGVYRALQLLGKPSWVDRDEVPWPAGFAWLDAPLDFRDRWGKAAYNRALSWDLVYLPYENRRVPGIRLVSWSHPGDRDAYWHENLADTADEFGGLVMGNSFTFPFGQRLLTQRYEGYPESDSTAIWLKALWTVMESEISVTAQARDVDGLVRRQASKSLVHGQVHVVLLRRKQAVPDGDSTGGPRLVNWTCRWPVEGFWRHVRRVPGEPPHHAAPDETRQSCVTCGAKVSFVNTFIKGPAGLPLKQDKQLYRLAR